MIKTYCDICSHEITENSTLEVKDGRSTLQGEVSVKGKRLNIQATAQVSTPWHCGDICKYCIFDAFKELDDRTQPIPQHINTPAGRTSTTAKLAQE